MKKTFKLIAIATLALGLTVACKSNKAEEPVEDSTLMELIDTTNTIEEIAEEIVENVEEPVKKTVKETAKKVESEFKEATNETLKNTTEQNTTNKLNQKIAKDKGLQEASNNNGTKAENATVNAPDTKTNTENKLKRR